MPATNPVRNQRLRSGQNFGYPVRNSHTYPRAQLAHLSPCAVCTLIPVRNSHTYPRAQLAQRPSASIVALPTVNPNRRAASSRAWASSWSSSSVTWPQVPADQELRRVVGIAMAHAADIGGKTLEFVDQPMFQQEFERPVYGRRGRAMAGLAQPIQQVIGAGRSFGLEDQPQDFPPQIGQASAFRLADLARVCQQCLGPWGKPHMALRGPVGAE